MRNPIGFGLAVAVTASLGFASTSGDGVDKNRDPKADDNRNPLWQEEGVRITFEPGRGVTFEKAGEAMLNVSGVVQAKFYYANNETLADPASFQARRVRTDFSGYVFNEDIQYRLQVDHSGNSSILDAYGDWHFYNAESNYLGLRFGVQKMRGSLQFDTEGYALEMNERSLATKTFSESRDLGVLLHGGAMAAEDGEYKLHYHFGAMNNGTAFGASGAAPGTLPGQAIAQRAGQNGDNKLMYTAGAFFAHAGASGTEAWTEGDLAHSGEAESLFGAQVMLGDQTLPATAPVEVETMQFALSGAFKSGSGIAGQAELFFRNDDPTQGGGTDADSTGFYLQGSYTTAPKDGTQYGFVGRYSMVDFDNGAPLFGMPAASGTTGLVGAGDVSEFQLGVNAYYHEHMLKTQLNYTFQSVSPDAGGDADNHGIDIMFTLLF